MDEREAASISAKGSTWAWLQANLKGPASVELETNLRAFVEAGGVELLEDTELRPMLERVIEAGEALAACASEALHRVQYNLGASTAAAIAHEETRRLSDVEQLENFRGANAVQTKNAERMDRLFEDAERAQRESGE